MTSSSPRRKPASFSSSSGSLDKVRPAGVECQRNQATDRQAPDDGLADAKMVEKGILDMDDLVEVWKSPLIPNGPILVSNALPADFKAKVVAAVKKLDTEDHACFIKAMGGTQHIGPGSVADFQQIIDMKRELVSAR